MDKKTLMARILTGVQSTGVPHLGNIMGAIQPAVNMSNDPGNEALLFIADLHSLTSIKDGALIRENTYAVAAAWLAFGYNTEKNIFFRQSDVPEVCELAWYLNCHTPIPMLENAHSFKDKSASLSKDKINTGLFTYPVLMAADILLYNTEIVPVGKDQKQHLEMTRDIARSFNHQHGEVFVQPEPQIDEKVMVIPGTDGRKMSKSYGNGINIFQTDKKLKKNIGQIVTDSKELEEPKNPDTCNVFTLYKLFASQSDQDTMRSNYINGGYGYGHAKQALFELVLERFKEPRAKYESYINDKSRIDAELKNGAEKARTIAQEVLGKIRQTLGY